jgi:FkbM family methyltransferase
VLKRARVLGDGYYDQARIAAAGWGLRLRRRGAVRPFCLNLRLGVKPTPYWVCDLAQLWNLDEIWVAQEYAPIAGGNYDLVLDLGANVGAASIWLHEQHRNAQIVAVEPDPLTAPLLLRNTMPFDRIRVVQAAVGLQEGQAELQSYGLSWGSHISSREISPAQAQRGPVRSSTVNVTTIPALIRAANLDGDAKVLAKVDIEGSEWPLLRTPDALRQVSEIYGETHPLGAPVDPDRFLEQASVAAGFQQIPARRTFFHWRRQCKLG